MVYINEIFEGVTAKQWKNKIQFELSGAPYDSLLNKDNSEGIFVKPFYHKDEIKKDFPKQPFISSKPFFTLYYKNIAYTLSNIEKVKNLGIKNVRLVLLKIDDDFFSALSLFEKNQILVWIEILNLELESLKKVIDYVHQNTFVKLLFDPLQQFMFSGNWSYQDQKADFELWQKCIKAHQPVYIKGSIFSESGANNVQQIAYILSHFNEYLNLSEGLKKLDVILEITQNAAFYFERVKNRVLISLLQQLANYYSIKVNIQILSKSTYRYFSLFDALSNRCHYKMFVFGAIWDSNTFFEVNASYFRKDEWRDLYIQIKDDIQKKYPNPEGNPLEGSYYVVDLMRQFSEKSFGIFKNIESGGGLVAQLIEGQIQKKIEESHNKELTNFEKSKFDYSNTLVKEYFDNNKFYLPKQHVRKTLIKPIIQRRLSEALELKCFKKYKSSLNEKK